MKPFMDEDFLLSTDTAKTLYHTYAENLPILDYHCHVSPREIAENKSFSNIAEVWLGGDHYKWRAMRSCGVEERCITGDASDYEKFFAYASVMPKLIGNPLYHWSHLELKRYFDCDLPLSASTADEIWAITGERLSSPDFSVHGILKKSNVEALCTTDDPIDTLEYHRAIKASDLETDVYPAFRPDKGLNCSRKGYTAYIASLAKAAGTGIATLADLKDAYANRIAFFTENGCRTADHGIDEQVPFAPDATENDVDRIFRAALASDGDVTREDADRFRTYMLRFFGGEYKKRGWIMQIHFGPLRNVNKTAFRLLGPDSGYDVIGGRTSVTELAGLLDFLRRSDSLPKTILYSINPADNAPLAALIGAFQERGEDGLPTVYQGSAWWFNDHIHGMREQLTVYAADSALGFFPGMLTDSRSFLSYPRHEYFRRILCDLVGGWAEDGQIPLDWEMLGDLVSDISYCNTKNLFHI